MNQVEKHIIDGSYTKPRLYKVDIPDEKVDKLLNWDIPLSKQTDEIQGQLMELFTSPGFAGRVNATIRRQGARTSSGMDFDEVSALVQGAHRGQLPSVRAGDIMLTLWQAYGSKQAASMALRKHGIPGLKFLDGFSRKGATRAQMKTWKIVPSKEGDPLGRFSVMDDVGRIRETFDTKAEATKFMQPREGTRNLVLWEDVEKIKITRRLNKKFGSPQ